LIIHGGEHPLAVKLPDGVTPWRSALLTEYPIDCVPYYNTYLHVGPKSGATTLEGLSAYAC